MKIYCKCGKSAEALEILEIMKDEDIHPNEITYLKSPKRKHKYIDYANIRDSRLSLCAK